MARRTKRGFTLLEIMMAVAVVSVVAAMAVPSYNNDLYRAQRSEAFEQLTQISVAQQIYRTNNDVYADDFPQLQLGPGLVRIGPGMYRGKRYTFTLSRPWGPRSWFCAASANLDGDPWPDVVVAYEGNP